MISLNKIMTEPFTDTSVKTEVVGDTSNGKFGVAKITNTKTTLVKLKVLADAYIVAGQRGLEIDEGSFVWVRADQYAAPWGKEVFTSPDGNTKFILLPVDRIEIFEDEDSENA